MPRLLGPVLLALFVAAPSVAEPEERWEPFRQKDGIRVSRLVDPAGPPVSRAETEIEAGLFEVLAVLRDAPRRVEWLSRCVESRNLTEPEGGVALSYTRTRGVWPVADRDSVVRSRVRIAPEGDAAVVELESVESPLAPEVEGVVRLPHLRAAYRLREVAPGRVRVDYRNSVDLGGRVPGFVQRFVREDMPFETVRGLRAQVERTRSEYAAQAQSLREGASGASAPPPLAR